MTLAPYPPFLPGGEMFGSQWVWNCQPDAKTWLGMFGDLLLAKPTNREAMEVKCACWAARLLCLVIYGSLREPPAHRNRGLV